MGQKVDKVDNVPRVLLQTNTKFLPISKRYLKWTKIGMVKRYETIMVSEISPFGLLIGFASCQESLNLGSSQDWLSTGSMRHIGPYYYHNSDLPIGIQRFLIDYPSYPPIYYPSNYPTYSIYYHLTRYPYYYRNCYYNSDYFPLETFGARRQFVLTKATLSNLLIIRI
jgi:hypothetical protein